MCFVAMLECSSLVSCCILDGIVLLIAELCHYCFACHLQTVHSIRWSLYRFRPKSTHLSSGALGLPSWGLVQSFPSEARICIAYHIPHIMPCFASCCLRIAPWLIVSPFACVLALGRAGRRVRDRGTRWECLRGSSLRQLGELCRQDDHTLEITSIFACQLFALLLCRDTYHLLYHASHIAMWSL